MTIYFNLASVVEVGKSMMAEHLGSAINFLGREAIHFTTHSVIPVAIVVTAFSLAALAILFFKSFSKKT